MTDLQRLSQYIKKYWKRLVISVGAASLYGFFAAAPTYALRYVIDKIFVGGLQHLIIPFIFGFVILLACKGFFAYISMVYMRWVGNRVVNDIRIDLFDRIIYYPLSFFKKKTTGELMAHFLNDIAMIENTSSLAVKNGIRSLFETVFLITIAFIQSWKLAMLSFFVAPFIIMSLQRIGRAAKSASRAIQEEVGVLSSLLQEIFVGIREVKIFNGEELEKVRLRQGLSRYFSSLMYNVKVEAFGPVFIESLAMLGSGFVFYVAAQQVLSGAISPGQVTSFFAAVLLSYQPIKRLISAYTSVQFGLAAANRIFSVIDQDYTFVQNRSIQVSAFHNAITFKNVSFSYADTAVLRDVNLVIRKGERIGLIGPSGSGKSTLCDLLLGFLEPTQGAIYIDETDITQILLKSLRSIIGSVSQQTFLFNDTVLENVKYAQKDMANELILQACENAYAHEFIEQFGNGYQTMVGENGSRLSGGQKQRITIARMLLKNPDILIFDEATSSLDSQSEEMIRLAIEEISKTKTVIIVSHRLSLIQKMDRVFAIENGCLVEKPMIKDFSDPLFLDKSRAAT